MGGEKDAVDAARAEGVRAEGQWAEGVEVGVEEWETEEREDGIMSLKSL